MITNHYKIVKFLVRKIRRHACVPIVINCTRTRAAIIVAFHNAKDIIELLFLPASHTNHFQSSNTIWTLFKSKIVWKPQ